MPLYQLISETNVSQVKPTSFQSEKQLHKLFEANLEKPLGVRFTASEFFTGDRQKGRIDTLGLDQDGSHAEDYSEAWTPGRAFLTVLETIHVAEEVYKRYQ